MGYWYGCWSSCWSTNHPFYQWSAFQHLFGRSNWNPGSFTSSCSVTRWVPLIYKHTFFSCFLKNDILQTFEICTPQIQCINFIFTLPNFFRSFHLSFFSVSFFFFSFYFFFFFFFCQKREQNFRSLSDYRKIFLLACDKRWQTNIKTHSFNCQNLRVESRTFL